MSEIGWGTAEFLLGVCSGGAAAAGVFALVTVIGIIPRLAGVTRSAIHVTRYEWAVIAGGSLGNLWYLLKPELWQGKAGTALELFFGMMSGIFVGSLIMALAEVWQVFPIIIRRTRLRVGIRYIGLAIAFGKTAGALLYFLKYEG